uniref:Uncharacterized protein n=1 Tax=Eptatretus burgeri TaxID=7764 RepID=A0A8C4QB18_EPTBU
MATVFGAPLLVLCIALPGFGLPTCPTPCSCTVSRVNCSSAGLMAVPDMLEERCGPYTHVDLSGNNISILGNNTFQKCTNLQELYLNASRISTIGKHAFDGCVRLNLLNMDDNLLRSFPLELGSLVSLRELSTRRNQFDNIKDTTGLRGLGNLTRLYIGPQSRCRDLTNFYKTAALLTLQELDLRDMQLYNMPFLLAGELRVLDVSGNQINLPNNVFDKSPHLRILRLRGCHLKVLTALNKLRQLQELDIRDNPIHPLTVLQQITCIDLSWRLVLLAGERLGPSQCRCWNDSLANAPQQLKQHLLLICDNTCEDMSGTRCFMTKQSWSYDLSRCRDTGISRRVMQPDLPPRRIIHPPAITRISDQPTTSIICALTSLVALLITAGVLFTLARCHCQIMQASSKNPSMTFLQENSNSSGRAVSTCQVPPSILI